MVTTRRRSYAPKNDSAKQTSQKKPQSSADPHHRSKAKPRPTDHKTVQASSIAYGRSKSRASQDSAKDSSAKAEYLLVIALAAVVVLVYALQRHFAAAPQSVDCRGAGSVAAGDAFLAEVAQTRPSVADVSPLDYASFAETMRSFMLDLTYDWQTLGLAMGPARHAVSARIEGSDKRAVLELVEAYLKRSLSGRCYQVSVIVVDLAELDPKAVRDRIDKHLSSKGSGGGALRVVVVENSQEGAKLMQLKSHLDAEQIVVNETTGEEVNSKGVGFLFASATLPNTPECNEIDTLVKDEQVHGWRRSFLGRITYRARVC